MCTSIYKGEIEVFITLEIEKEEEKIICIKSPVDIAIDEGELIYLKNQDLIDEKKETYEDGEEHMIHLDSDYAICPSCGCTIFNENDGENGFCEDCAKEYYRQPIGYQESLTFAEECILRDEHL